MRNVASKMARNRSQFITSCLVPVRHTEADLRFSLFDTALAVAMIFGTVAMMRLVLGVLGNNFPMN